MLLLDRHYNFKLLYDSYYQQVLWQKTEDQSCRSHKLAMLVSYLNQRTPPCKYDGLGGGQIVNLLLSFRISNWDILWYIPGVKIISSKKGHASPYAYIGGGGVVLKHSWCGYFIYRNTTNSINVYKFCFVKLSLAVATCICSILRTEDFFIPVI